MTGQTAVTHQDGPLESEIAVPAPYSVSGAFQPVDFLPLSLILKHAQLVVAALDNEVSASDFQSADRGGPVRVIPAEQLHRHQCK